MEQFEGLVTNDGDKKRKKYRDVLVKLNEANNTLVISDIGQGDDDKGQRPVYSGKIDSNKMKKFKSGEEIDLTKNIKAQLCNKIDENVPVITPSIAPTKLSSKPFILQSSSIQSTSSSVNHNQLTTAAMKSNQILIERVTNKPFVQQVSTMTQNNSSKAPTTLPPINITLDPLIVKKLNPHQALGAEWLLDRMYGKYIPDGDEKYTGAILADEMGLGKTLTSLCVMWSIVNSKVGKCRGIIIAPASLIDNWLNEIRKWIGGTVYPLTIRSGSDVSKTLSAFSHDSLFNKKILVTSYSMYSKFHSELNKISRLDVIICDEGHRLKNARGNNLTEALRGCRAKMRMLLTGTPMQNDLEELYAVVNFVCPGYLGSLAAYKAEFSNVIVIGNESCSNEHVRAQGKLAANKLGLKINQILLRRTQDEVLKSLLPPKEEYILFCAMTQLQDAEYDAVSAHVLDDSSLLKHDSVVSVNDNDDEAIEDNGKIVSAGDVISCLQCLRRVCNFARSTDVGPGSLDNLYKLSSKIQILDTILSCVPSADKTVIVSNFTSMLALVEELCGLRKWPFLRLDGRTPTDKRQNLVDAFNRSSDPHKIFLISSKGNPSINLFIFLITYPLATVVSGRYGFKFNRREPTYHD